MDSWKTNKAEHYRQLVFHDHKEVPKCMRVLILDHCSTSRKILSETMRICGHLVVETDSGNVATNMIKNSITTALYVPKLSTFDLIFVCKDEVEEINTIRDLGFSGLILVLVVVWNKGESEQFKSQGADGILEVDASSLDFHNQIRGWWQCNLVRDVPSFFMMFFYCHRRDLFS